MGENTAGRVLSKEEIESIKHTITPLNRIKAGTRLFTDYIDAEPYGKKVRRNETMDGLRK